MEFRLLGPFEVVVDGHPVNLGGRQRRTLLAILTIHSGETVSTERLIDELWGDSPPSAARKSIQAHIAHLRREINDQREILSSADDGYVLRTSHEEVDSQRFERLVAQSEEMRPTNALEAAAALEQALGLFRGAPLAGLADDAFSLRVEASRLEELRISALEDRLETLLDAGEHKTVAAEAQRLVAEYPLRERLWGSLMIGLYRSGRQAEALRAFGRARILFAEELGIEPSTSLRQLEQQILEHDDASGLGTPVVGIPDVSKPIVRNPYKGLRAFDESDSADFFGRDELVRRLTERVSGSRPSPLTVLAGPSGTGKSSAVRAGLVPTIRDRDIAVGVMVPGSDPLSALAKTLGEIANLPTSEVLGTLQSEGWIGPAVVVVDQFEELFTMTGNGDTADQFLDLMSSSNDDLRWVATVRTDYLDRVLSHPSFGPLVDEALVLVPSLGEHEVRAAVTAPARRVGVEVDPGLVATIVTDVRARAAALPLMQYALTDCFDRRQGDTMALADYERSGGISGALVRRAEDLFSTLDGENQGATRKLFLQLVAVTEEGEVVRRRVETPTLLDSNDEPMVRSVIERFGAIRLLVFDQDQETGTPTVEIAHETLITEWPRLGTWIDQARDDLRRRHRLALSASEWEETGRDAGYLLTGARLAEMRAWQETSQIVLLPAEADYLDRSRRAEESATRRRRLRRRVFGGALGVTAAVAVVFAVVASRSAEEARTQASIAEAQTQRAEEQAAVAEEQARIAVVRQLAAASAANLRVDAELSILLALEAVDRSGKAVLPEAEEALHRAVLADNLIASVPNGGNGLAHFSPDGTRFISQGEDPSTVQVWSVDPVTPLMTLAGHQGQVLDAVYDKAGTRIASTSADGTVRIWDTQTGETETVLTVPGSGIPIIPVFSWDGAQLGVSREDGAVLVFDLTSGDSRTLGPRPGTFFALNLDFSPDGSLLAVAPENDQNTVQVWDLETGDLAARLVGHEAAVKDVGFTPDGSKLVTGSFDTTNRVWDTEAWQTVLIHTGHQTSVWDIQISADGHTVASSGNNEAVVWDLETGETLNRVVGHDGVVDGVDIDRQAKILLTGSMVDRTTRLWVVSPTGVGELYATDGTTQAFGAVAFSPDGGLLAVSRDDGLVVLLEAATGAETTRFETSGPVENLAFHPQGRWLAVGGPWGLATYDLELQQLTPVLGLWTSDVVFSRSGSLGAATDGGAFVWSDPLGESLVLRTSDPAFTLAFDPNDGEMVASVDDGDAGKLEVWDLQTGDLLASHVENGDLVFGITFSPDGEWFFTGSLNAHADFWSGNDFNHLRRLDPSIGQIFDVDVTADGGRVMTAGDDETIRIIDVDTGAVELTLPGQPFSHIDLTPDGRYLAATGPTGPVMVYVLETERLIQIAERRLTRWWSPSECVQYLETETCPSPPEGFTSLLP